MDITIAGVGLAALITAVLTLVFYVVPEIPNRVKPVIAVFTGMGLGLVAMVYAEAAFTAKLLIDHLATGFLVGLASVGLHEFKRAGVKPRR